MFYFQCDFKFLQNRHPKRYFLYHGNNFTVDNDFFVAGNHGNRTWLPQSVTHAAFLSGVSLHPSNMYSLDVPRGMGFLHMLATALV